LKGYQKSNMLTAKKPRSASCPTLVVEHGTTLTVTEKSLAETSGQMKLSWCLTNQHCCQNVKFCEASPKLTVYSSGYVLPLQINYSTSCLSLQYC